MMQHHPDLWLWGPHVHPERFANGVSRLICHSMEPEPGHGVNLHVTRVWYFPIYEENEKLSADLFHMPWKLRKLGDVWLGRGNGGEEIKKVIQILVLLSLFGYTQYIRI